MNWKLWALVLVLAGCTSTPHVNKEITNNEGEKIIIGLANWDGLVQAPYGEWFVPNYKDYVVDSATLNTVSSMAKIKIVMFMGTWCEDSHMQVPQFFKILDYLKYDINEMMVIGLEKIEEGVLVSPTHEEEGMNITHVPSFIFYRNGQEIGRIVEYPEMSLEKDMAKILND